MSNSLSLDHNPPGSLVHGILQVRILEWFAMPSSKGYSLEKKVALHHLKDHCVINNYNCPQILQARSHSLFCFYLIYLCYLRNKMFALFYELL